MDSVRPDLGGIAVSVNVGNGLEICSVTGGQVTLGVSSVRRVRRTNRHGEVSSTPQSTVSARG